MTVRALTGKGDRSREQLCHWMGWLENEEEERRRTGEEIGRKRKKIEKGEVSGGQASGWSGLGLRDVRARLEN